MIAPIIRGRLQVEISHVVMIEANLVHAAYRHLHASQTIQSRRMNLLAFPYIGFEARLEPYIMCNPPAWYSWVIR